jgi:hypothetical protein
MVATDTTIGVGMVVATVITGLIITGPIPDPLTTIRPTIGPSTTRPRPCSSFSSDSVDPKLFGTFPRHPEKLKRERSRVARVEILVPSKGHLAIFGEEHQLDVAESASRLENSG